MMTAGVVVLVGMALPSLSALPTSGVMHADKRVQLVQTSEDRCPEDCNGNGVCEGGLCECFENWAGLS